ncbi:MAG: hypothetical protein GY755_03525 [Chloroflexi bacterium]|nr:hypothetical protein [Chloroflexota bacterium]
MVKKLKNKTWLIWGIIAVALVLWGWFAVGNNGFQEKATSPDIFLHLFIWLLIGILIRLEEDIKYHSLRSEFWAFLIEYIFLTLLWHVSIKLPPSKLDDYGLVLNLKESPLIFLASVAFLLGHYRRVALKIPIVIKNLIRKNFGAKEDKGFAKYHLDTFLRGFGEILGLDNARKD